MSKEDILTNKIDQKKSFLAYVLQIVHGALNDPIVLICLTDILASVLGVLPQDQNIIGG